MVGSSFIRIEAVEGGGGRIDPDGSIRVKVGSDPHATPNSGIQ